MTVIKPQWTLHCPNCHSEDIEPMGGYSIEDDCALYKCQNCRNEFCDDIACYEPAKRAAAPSADDSEVRRD